MANYWGQWQWPYGCYKSLGMKTQSVCYHTLPMHTYRTHWGSFKQIHSVCDAQKKMSLESSLLQDITVLNGNDSSQLEDWLTDIETTSDLTGESRTKLAQAKSKGLIWTLIWEALTLNKTWEEIKDSLHLKICNLDIHISVSHFMEIQQKEKESLAAYIHHFKREASRCKFNNDAATIRIFIKGLRNAHTLATRVYEKGPQSLAYAIKEVEKLQTAQQINSYLITLILSKYHVKWWWQMLPVSGIGTYGTMLPSYKVFWLWWLWPCHSRLPR